jgi:hypothetical protein
MGFEFKSDQPEQKLVDSKITLSENELTPKIVEFTPYNPPANAKSGAYEEFGTGDNNLTQDIFAEGEEEQLAIEFLEENGLYAKFLLWCGIKEQLKNLKLSLATPTE